MNNISTMDIKVGYACNNNCIHCVVKPNYLFNPTNKDNNSREMNLTYASLIELINSKEAAEATHITLTGGEPTIRKDFLRLVKYIYTKHPDKVINLQTNGRKLKEMAKELYEISNGKIKFVIALHGATEELHNKIVDNRIKDGNAYKETIDSIEEILKYFDPYSLRIEVVLSKYNYFDVMNILNYCKKINVKHIGFSYPHFDGFYYHDLDYAKENSISFNLLKPYLIDICNFAEENPDFLISLEAIPPCMLTINKKYKMLSNILLDKPSTATDSIIRYPNKSCSEEFCKAKLYEKKESCKECCYSHCCHGTWFEALDIFPEDNYEILVEVLND